MKRILLNGLVAGLFALSLSLPAFAALKEGDTAPDFSTQASLNGKAFSFSLQAALKKGPVVVYFYPSAFTGGCNIQAHTFAVNQEKFAAAGVTIIGVSLDSITRLNAFSADPEYCAGKFPVASDANGQIAKSYDLAIRQIAAGKKDSRGVEIDHDATERTTFVISPNGKIIASVGGLSPVDNVHKSLEIAQAISR